MWDHVNAVFEAVGAVLAWVSVVRLAKVGQVSGISRLQISWSGLWAAECGPYYASHHDWFSLAAAAVRMAGTLTWVVLAFRCAK